MPLVFDLDGTLHEDDLSWIDYKRALLQRPVKAISLAPMSFTARARLKCNRLPTSP